MAVTYADLPAGTGSAGSNTSTIPAAPAANINPIQQVGSGIADIIRVIRGSSASEGAAAAAAADPFAAQRPGYQTDLRTSIDNPANTYMSKLNTLLSNPGSFQTDPGYQFAKEQGLEGVARHGNAMFGGTRSGNTAVALDKYGTGFAEQAYDTRVQQLLAGAGQEQTNYNQRINSLLTASGANQGSPATAGQLLERSQTNSQRDLSGALAGGAALANLLMKSGIPQSVAEAISKAIGGGADLSNANLGGSTEDFLTSIGIDPASLPQNDLNVLTIPGSPQTDLNLPDTIDPSSANIIGDLGGSIFDIGGVP